MEALREYLIVLYGPEFEAIGLSKKASVVTVEAIIKNANKSIENKTMKSMLTSIGTVGGAGAFLGLAKSLLSKSENEPIGNFLSDMLKKTIAYGALGSGIGGGLSYLFPSVSSIVGSNIMDVLKKENTK